MSTAAYASVQDAKRGGVKLVADMAAKGLGSLGMWALFSNASGQSTGAVHGITNVFAWACVAVGVFCVGAIVYLVGLQVGLSATTGRRKAKVTTAKALKAPKVTRATKAATAAEASYVAAFASNAADFQATAKAAAEAAQIEQARVTEQAARDARDASRAAACARDAAAARTLLAETEFVHASVTAPYSTVNAVSILAGVGDYTAEEATQVLTDRSGGFYTPDHARSVLARAGVRWT